MAQLYGTDFAFRYFTDTVDLGATPSPYNVMSYGSHPHMASGQPPQPPPYDECMKTAASMQAIHMSNMDPSASYGYVHYDYRNHMQVMQRHLDSIVFLFTRHRVEIFFSFPTDQFN